jgi:hypothetical protein
MFSLIMVDWNADAQVQRYKVHVLCLAGTVRHLAVATQRLQQQQQQQQVCTDTRE